MAVTLLMASRAKPGWPTVGMIRGGVLLILGGLLGCLSGISGIAGDDVFAQVEEYGYGFGRATWGWIHVVLGVLMIPTGIWILTGAAWARITGVALTAVYIIGKALWIPYHHWWGLISIAIGLFVIWGLCTAGRPPEPGG